MGSGPELETVNHPLPTYTKSPFLNRSEGVVSALNWVQTVRGHMFEYREPEGVLRPSETMTIDPKATGDTQDRGVLLWGDKDRRALPSILRRFDDNLVKRLAL